MPEVRLRVRRQFLLAGDDSRASSASVFCPAQLRSVDCATCKNCAYAHFVLPKSVVCAPPNSSLPQGTDAPAATAALSEVTLVRADVRAPALIMLSQLGPSRVPVVDGRDRFLGFVSPRLLEGPTWPWHRLAATLAGEVVSEASLFALETVTVGDVLRLMARRGARSVALVDRSGLLQGIVLDVDALRAMGSAETQLLRQGCEP